ncbi:MAG: flagellin [Myxococcota bacterium]
MISFGSNVLSLFVNRAQANNARAGLQSARRLSSGFRINSASDDAAGLAVSEQLRARVASFRQAERNTGSGLAMARTAESGAGGIDDALVRMRELAVQAADGGLSSADRDLLNTEYQSLAAEVDRLSESTEFNGTELLSGAANTVTYQVGINTGAGNTIDVGFGGVSTASLGLSPSGIAGADGSSASSAISALDGALQRIGTTRARFGAAIGRLQVAQDFTVGSRINLEAARSTIADTDVAAEAARFAKSQVRTRAGIGVAAAANQFPRVALRLLGAP